MPLHREFSDLRMEALHGGFPRALSSVLGAKDLLGFL